MLCKLHEYLHKYFLSIRRNIPGVDHYVSVTAVKSNYQTLRIGLQELKHFTSTTHTQENDKSCAFIPSQK